MLDRTHLQISHEPTISGMCNALRTSLRFKYVRMATPLVQGGSSFRFCLKKKSPINNIFSLIFKSFFPSSWKHSLIQPITYQYFQIQTFLYNQHLIQQEFKMLNNHYLKHIKIFFKQIIIMAFGKLGVHLSIPMDLGESFIIVLVGCRSI